MTFSKAGTYKFFCWIHGPDMAGTIVVTRDPVEDRHLVTRRSLGGRRAHRLAALAVCAAAVAALNSPPRPRRPGRPGLCVEYWVAAVPVNWHVIPNERDAMMGETFDPAETTFQTVVYRQYTKDWAKQIPNEPGDRGIQGPLLHARVGDTILVHFENLDTAFNRPHSMHFHGVHYRPGSDGSYIPGFSGPGANVAPGKSFTYRLVAGPDSAGVWPYHDHSPSMDESISGGLYGALSILGPNEQPPDHEFVVYFEQTLDFMTIDGRAFVGNTPVFKAKVGDLVQWDVLDARRRLPHLPRPRPPLADRRRDVASTHRPSGRPRASRSSGARTIRARGCTTATSRPTWTTG